MADGPALYVRRKGELLLPADRWTADRVRDFMKEGREYRLKTWSSRNAKQHRFFWALCQKVYENSDFFNTPEHVAYQLKIGTGRCDVVLVINEAGEMVRQFVPHSISYAAMSQEEFEPFLNDAIDWIIKYIWPTLTQYEIRQEVSDMIGIPMDMAV